MASLVVAIACLWIATPSVVTAMASLVIAIPSFSIAIGSGVTAMASLWIAIASFSMATPSVATAMASLWIAIASFSMATPSVATAKASLWIAIASFWIAIASYSIAIPRSEGSEQLPSRRTGWSHRSLVQRRRARPREVLRGNRAALGEERIARIAPRKRVESVRAVKVKPL
jgi:hypothetical protein